MNSLQSEAFIHWRRSPSPGLKFVRECLWGHAKDRPHSLAFIDREVLGWSLAHDGQCIRVWSVRVDVPNDGTDEWEPDQRKADKPVDPTSIRLRTPSKPPVISLSPPEVSGAEAGHRQSFALHWAKHHESKAIGDRAAAEALKAEAIRAANTPNIIVTPKPKPRSLLNRLIGRK
jgi:hypothetical protein